MKRKKFIKNAIIIVSVVLIFFIGCSNPIDKSKFKDVEKRAQRIRSDIEGGINYKTLGSNIDELTSEIKLLRKEKLEQEEIKLFDKYIDLLNTYIKAHVVWGVKFKVYCMHDDKIKGDICDITELIDIQNIIDTSYIPDVKYEVNKRELLNVDSAIDIFFRRANTLHDDIEKIYKNN